MMILFINQLTTELPDSAGSFALGVVGALGGDGSVGYLGSGMSGTVGMLSPPCPWNSPWWASARNGNRSR